METRNAKRVLVYRLGSLGDTIVALPSLHLISKAFPNAKRVLLTEFPINVKAPASAAVLGDTGLIHGYLRYSKGTRNPLELFLLWCRIAKFRADVLVYLMPVLEPRLVRRNVSFFRLAGIRNFVGVPEGDPRARQFNSSTGLFEREAHRLARSLSALGNAEVDDPISWNLKLSAAECSIADDKINALSGSPFIACSIGTKSQSNDWTTPNWTILLTELSRLKPEYGLLFIGSADEEADCEVLAAVWRGPTVNACGKLNPRQSGAAVRNAALFVGHDSGPLHLAACLQVPCVGVYGARNLPGVWFPVGRHVDIIHHDVECRGCQLHVCVTERKKCILSITPTEVLSTILKRLPQA